MFSHVLYRARRLDKNKTAPAAGRGSRGALPSRISRRRRLNKRLRPRHYSTSVHLSSWGGSFFFFFLRILTRVSHYKDISDVYRMKAAIGGISVMVSSKFNKWICKCPVIAHGDLSFCLGCSWVSLSTRKNDSKRCVRSRRAVPIAAVWASCHTTHWAYWVPHAKWCWRQCLTVEPRRARARPPGFLGHCSTAYTWTEWSMQFGESFSFPQSFLENDQLQNRAFWSGAQRFLKGNRICFYLEKLALFSYLSRAASTCPPSVHSPWTKMYCISLFEVTIFSHWKQLLSLYHLISILISAMKQAFVNKLL